MRHRRRSIPTLAAWALHGCAQAAEPEIVEDSQAVIYGSDDRIDLFEASEAVREHVVSSALAAIKPTQMRFGADGSVRLVAAPLRVQNAYCEGTPFLDQPTAARCSATLIDSDLILTVAHCVRGLNQCRSLAYVTGYAQMAPQHMPLRSREDVYSCRKLVLRGKNSLLSDERFDYAIIQLDRAVQGKPVSVRTDPPPTEGEKLTVVGFPEGLPAKVDSGAVLVDARADARDSFALTSDTFQGSSGSGVFDASLELIGVFAAGTADVVQRGDCAQNRVLDPNVPSREVASYAGRAIDELCASGWPSERLCGAIARCGDGVCSVSSEDHASCPSDCSAATCGDHLCERVEWDNCDDDCGDRRPKSVPDAWYCDPYWYGDGKTCDCDCGAADPDCTDEMRHCERAGPSGREPSADPAANGCSAPGSATDSNAAITWLVLGLAALRAARRRRSSHFR